MPDFNSSIEAEAAFYAALREGSLRQMATLWCDDDHIACVHPGAAPLTGRRAVMESWREILEHGGPGEVEFRTLSARVAETQAIHLVSEMFPAAGKGPPAAVLATNAYALTAAGWKMVWHHTGPWPRGQGRRGGALH